MTAQGAGSPEAGDEEAGPGTDSSGVAGVGPEKGDDQASQSGSLATPSCFRPEIRSPRVSRGPKRVGQGEGLTAISVSVQVPLRVAWPRDSRGADRVGCWRTLAEYLYPRAGRE